MRVEIQWLIQNIGGNQWRIQDFQDEGNANTLSLGQKNLLQGLCRILHENE